IDRRQDRRAERLRDRVREVRRAERRLDRQRDRRAERRYERRQDRRYDRQQARRYVHARPRVNYIYRPHFWGRVNYRWDNRYRGFDYGRHYRAGYGYYGPVISTGWHRLYPWLKNDPAARHWVMWEFDRNRNGRLGKKEARRANRAFDRLADYDRDGRLSRWEIDDALYELRDEYRFSYSYG
ncbi:MAG: hypothetical protein WA906_04065, partial [Pacificimonas sp.]